MKGSWYTTKICYEVFTFLFIIFVAYLLKQFNFIEKNIHDVKRITNREKNL